MSTLGGYIRRRRDQRGWSRAELSRTSGVPYSTLSNIERNPRKVKPTEDTLRMLAVAFGEDDSQLRVLAGYTITVSPDASALAKRIDALMISSPRWESALRIIQEEMSLEEQNEAVTALETHIEFVRRRRNR